jgi:hypothetical protein
LGSSRDRLNCERVSPCFDFESDSRIDKARSKAGKDWVLAASIGISQYGVSIISDTAEIISVHILTGLENRRRIRLEHS